MYEESIRIPMIIYDPRAPKALRGQRRNEMVLSIDCAPTMLTTAGVPIPPEMQGKDLTPLIMGNRVPWRDDWFYEHTYTAKYSRNIPKSQGVRTSKWKYIRYTEQDPNYEQLFDLENDRFEMTNLAGNPKYADVLDNLRARYVKHDSELPHIDVDSNN